MKNKLSVELCLDLEILFWIKRSQLAGEDLNRTVARLLTNHALTLQFISDYSESRKDCEEEEE